MKKAVSLFLSAVLLLSLISCASEKGEQTETLEIVSSEKIETEEAKVTKEQISDPWKKPEEEKVQNNHTVVDKTAKEKLNAIPIANDSMSEDELRQICVDFMALQCSFTWIPSETFSHEGLNITREPGTLYGGIPYISMGSGNLYRALEYYDEATGIIDMSYFKDHQKQFSNACSGSVFWAWSRVVNSFNADDGAWTENCTHLNGCLRVGPYVYDDVKNFHAVKEEAANKFTAKEATLQNTDQVMYESYALTKPADGLVHPGHVRMVSKAPVVVRNADGTINPEKSYLHCHEQVHYVNDENHNRIQEDGTAYKAQGVIDRKYSFKDLYSKYYIPFTFAEFLGTDPVEKAYATLGIDSPTATIGELTANNVSSNYYISDVFITVTAPDGSVVYSLTRRMGAHYVKTAKTGSVMGSLAGVLKPYIETGDHTITFTVQSSTGEILTAYSGILVQS